MIFLLLHQAAEVWERRYDGPIPLRRAPVVLPSGVLERLAAESRALLAWRRQGLGASRLAGDAELARRGLALGQYRAQAVSLRGGRRV